MPVKCAPYPSGQAWLDALGFALMTDMPSGPHKSPHSFQLYIKQCLTHTRLREIWRAYLTDVIAETGRVWQTFIKPVSHPSKPNYQVPSPQAKDSNSIHLHTSQGSKSSSGNFT
ncbi:hypothetical protein HBH92_126060, partial [Parastagonospora nodorum]